MIAYGQIILLKDRIQKEFEKQNIPVEISDVDQKEYENWRRFDLEIEIEMHEFFDSSFLLTYSKDKEIPFRISHDIDSEGRLNEDLILKYRNQEFYQQYKMIEAILGDWIRGQSSIRLQYMFKPWLQKRISIRRIEESWENEKQR